MIRSTLLAVLFTLLTAAALVAQEGEGGMPDEMMAAMPGPGHEPLKQMLGAWDQKVIVTMMPGMPEMEGSGTAENTMILGGGM